MAKNYRRIIKMEYVARMEAKMLPDQTIADSLGMSYAGLAQLKQDPDYNAVRARVKNTAIGAFDVDLIDDIKYQHEQLRAMVPQALQNLFKLATESKNEKTIMAASTEILDREGHLAKVSRIGLATDQQGSVANQKDDEIANSLLNIRKIQEERAKKDDAKDLAAADTVSTTIQ
jgi:hypothetical protein